MGEVTVLFIAILFLVIIILSGRFFYLLEVKSVTRKLMTSLDFDALALNYSFEQMVYFHSLPSNIPIIKNATKENLSIEYDYKFFIFRYLRGISIYIKDGEQSIHLAYLTTNDLRFPTLDLLMEQGKIDEKSYLKIATYRLIHTKTLNEITDEVYKQMKIGRYKVS